MHFPGNSPTHWVDLLESVEIISGQRADGVAGGPRRVLLCRRVVDGVEATVISGEVMSLIRRVTTNFSWSSVRSRW